MSAPIQPDAEKNLDAFINCIFLPADLVEIRLLPGRKSSWHLAKDIPSQLTKLRQENAQGENIYFGVNPRTRKGGGKAKDVKLARYVFADFDYTDVATVRERLALMEFPEPTIIINSGHGVHCYWRLTQATADLKRWSQIQKRLIRHLDSDPKVCDAPRIMRMPGFMNHKEPPVQAKIVEINPARRYSIEEMERVLPLLPASALSVPIPSVPHKHAVGSSTSSSVDERAIAYVLKCEPSVSGQHGHDRAFTAARAVVYGFDLGVEKGLQVLLAHFNPACQPPWSEAELLHKCTEADTTPFDKPRGWLLNQNNNKAYTRTLSRNTMQQSSVKAEAALQDGVTDPLDPTDHIDNPHRLADEVQKHRRFWQHWKGSTVNYKDGRYEIVAPDTVQATTVSVIRNVFVKDAMEKLEQGEKAPKPKSVTRKLSGDVLQALNSNIHLEADSPPVWIGMSAYKHTRPASNYLNFQNGILDLEAWINGEKDAFILPTSDFFTFNVLPYPFNPSAPPPTTWLSFLRSQWANDAEAIECLQEWFGYLLTPDTRQHKILFLLGPPRAGKGVILRTLTKLLGESNVVSPVLSSFAGTFGLQPLLRKLLATITDMRVSGRGTEVITERLLSISGEDYQTIDQKHRDAITVRLPVRFVLASNELPRLRDASSALSKRLIFLQMGQTFFGREDRTLEAKLFKELPGILLWSIEGWKRLQQRGHFVQPASGAELADQYEDLNAFVKAFVREECYVNHEVSIERLELYQKWKEWCNQRGREPGSEELFGRDLRIVVPSIRDKRPRQNGERWWEYVGLRIRLPSDPQNDDRSTGSMCLHKYYAYRKKKEGDPKSLQTPPIEGSQDTPYRELFERNHVDQVDSALNENSDDVEVFDL